MSQREVRTSHGIWETSSPPTAVSILHARQSPALTSVVSLGHRGEMRGPERASQSPKVTLLGLAEQHPSSSSLAPPRDPGQAAVGRVGGRSPRPCTHTPSPPQASGARASTPLSALMCSQSSRGRRTASCRSSSRASRARFGPGAPTWTWATGRACCSSCVPTWRVPGEWPHALVTSAGRYPVCASSLSGSCPGDGSHLY